MHLCCLSLSRHCLSGSLRLFPPLSLACSSSSAAAATAERAEYWKFHLSILFHIHLLRAFPFSIDFGVHCLCLLRLTPPFLSVAVAHFVFSCCFTLCFGLFLSIRLLSIDYSPQLFFVSLRVCVLYVLCGFLLIHLQITCKTSYGPRTWHNCSVSNNKYISKEYNMYVLSRELLNAAKTKRKTEQGECPIR